MFVLPTGTVTFLFTDIEGSTRLWEQHPEAMRLALARHDTLLRQAIEVNNGVVFKTIGDAFCAAFATALDALTAALAAQQALHTELWTDTLSLNVRMALHTGAAELRDNDYFGQPLNRVSRLLAAGHGGQVLLSLPTEELVRDTLPSFISLHNMGQHRLRDLSRPETIFQLLHPNLPSDFAPLNSLDNSDAPNNLPQQVTSFIGREKEIVEVKALLGETRLLTLTGSGGCGKTRLSLQVAADMLEHYSEGVWLIELAPLANPVLVPQAVASVLRVREEAGKPLTQTLEEFLKAKTLLLLFDNCEHLLTACAQLADTLIRACPHVQVLASSREGLGIAGETIYRIPSLSLPDLRQTPTPSSLDAYEAVRLFVDRAMAALPAFAVTNANAPAVASVCHRLDGIPLAIELSAARVRSLSVEEINSKLDNRFRLLTGGNRAALPRQQTLRALIDWSYDLLNAQEKTLLCHLSVFAGGWTLAAAEAVGTGTDVEAWEVLDLLMSLTDKSLVVAERSDEYTRYRLLETVRQYARDRLVESGESDVVRTKHQDCYLAFAEEAKTHLIGVEQGQWLERLETEHENLRSALDWSCVEQTAEESLRLCGALWRYWRTRGYLSEGRERCERALAMPNAQEWTPRRATALNGAGNLTCTQGNYVSARVYQEESLAIRREIGDRSGISDSLHDLGNAVYASGDYAFARAYFDESLTIRKEIGDRRGIAYSANGLGNVAYEQGDYTSAGAYYDESLTINREIGDQAGIGNSLNNLGNVAFEQGDYASARVFYDESLVIRREIGDRVGIGNSLNNLGNVVYAQGDYASACAYQEESLTIRKEIGDRRGIGNSLNNLGNVVYAQGDYASACAYQEESLTIRKEIGDRRGIAISLNGLGNMAYKQGDYASARIYLEESLAISREAGDQAGIASSLEGFASVAARDSKLEQATALWGAAAALREQIGAPMPPNERESYEREVAEAWQVLGEEAFSTARAAGVAMTNEQAIEYALSGGNIEKIFVKE